MQMLEIVKLLVDNLAENKATYCHFKSNEHLDAALWGDTDLDILFDSEQVSLVEDAIFRAGFIRMKAVGNRKYQGIEDYIGIDDKEGKIVHVHAHYQLVGGESGVKPYHIKLEKQLLNNAQVYSSDCKILVARPEDELLLLLVRIALKLKAKDKLLSIFKDMQYSGDDKREFLWLLERVSFESFMQTLPAEFSNNKNKKVIKELFGSGLRHSTVKQFLAINSELFNGWRYLSDYRSLVVRINYFAVKYARKINRKFGITARKPIFRTFEKQGLIIAILGADGVGKSTQNKLLPLELRKKTDVLYMYMGAGDGKSSWHRYPLKKLKSLKAKSHSRNAYTVTESDKPVAKKAGGLRLAFKLLWAISLAFERKSKLGKIKKWREAGGIVICDRYPQITTYGFNDGPLLTSFLDSGNVVLRQIAKWEFGIYELATTVYPDMVIKLWVSVEELKHRRPEMPESLISEKQNSILSLEFPAETKVVKIHSVDGEKKVFVEIMQEIHSLFVKNFLSARS